MGMDMEPRTSLTDPIRMDFVAAGTGLIGMALCPGKWQDNALSGTWRRDLDLDRIAAWGAVAVATLMETDELARYHVSGLGAGVLARGMAWHHLPIRDFDIPRAPFEMAWAEAGPRLRAHLAGGRRIMLHCLGGLGRTGTIAARLLIESGMPASDAIAAVRAARPGAIETAEQLEYVRRMRPLD